MLSTTFETIQQFMLNFHRINSVSDPFFTNLFNLYALAFPPTERRSWAGLEYELNYEKRLYAYALLQDDKFVGFINYWLFDRFCYIEHFAVSPNLRGKHIGSEAMEILRSKTNLPIVLEVEMPNNPNSIRRIKFYERLGYKVLSHNYAQPPYEGNGFLIPLLIMCDNNHFASTHFELIKETLYTEVYHYEVEKVNEEEEL
jgi:ribosomal protein S18 acetylase RimI-like enzyme